MKCYAVLLACLTGLFLTQLPSVACAELPKVLLDAEEKLNADQMAAEGKYITLMVDARKAHLAKLDEILKKLTMAGNLEGALEVKKRKEEIEQELLELAKGAGNVPAFRRPVEGTWGLWYSNVTWREYRIDGRGNVQVVKAEKPIKVTRVVGQNGVFAAKLDDGNVERWTFANGRLFVEHWGANTSFPTSKPSVLAIGDLIDTNKSK